MAWAAGTEFLTPRALGDMVQTTNILHHLYRRGAYLLACVAVFNQFCKDKSQKQKQLNCPFKWQNVR